MIMQLLTVHVFAYTQIWLMDMYLVVPTVLNHFFIKRLTIFSFFNKTLTEQDFTLVFLIRRPLREYKHFI